MEQINIWDKINFTEQNDKSAYDLLVEQSKYLVKATSGELKMQVEAIDTYINGIDEEPPRLAALYILYVVAPKLGNYRRKILTVAEYSDSGRFPVDIFSHLDNSKKIDNVSGEKFLDTIEEILSGPIVQNSIVTLYKQSKGFSE